ncbi:MAG TPA: hypothetical protein VJT50_04250 [Pyrinomonadaceae bacterium]|nr:hypothetical protein [Pyrinomonadaceae bacterium]
MRIKLVILSAIIAAIIGAGGAIAIILFFFSSLEPLAKPGLAVLSTLLLPLVATFAASMFVYRHTARRRKLQATLTTLISLLLIVAAFVVASILTSRSRINQPRQQSPVSVR